MSENLRNYIKALYGLDHVMRAIPADAWDRPSTCSDWTVRELAGHASGVVEMVGAQARGDAPAPDNASRSGDGVGADPYASWYAIRDSTIESLDQQGVLTRIAQTPFGAMPIDAFIGFIAADALIHTWDMARSVGGDERLDADLVERALAALEPMAATLAKSGAFREPVAVAADADAQTRLLGMTGRTP